jgi:hypothetical protein
MTPMRLENTALKSLLEEEDRIERQIGKIKAACKVHTVRRSGDSAYCANCGEHLGWWCPKSPDHLCHYPPDDEWCRFCGDPTERK